MASIIDLFPDVDSMHVETVVEVAGGKIAEILFTAADLGSKEVDMVSNTPSIASCYHHQRVAVGDVVLYEKENYLGGHAKTVTMDDGVDLDLGFMVFNWVTYPNMVELFETLGVDIEHSDMSFLVTLDEGNGCEWGSRNGLSSCLHNKAMP
ncbi:hypothetical protein CTI12_AA428460 [Artemisia annua]|uniref:Amine oxidase domain-containing protein n=1 Tax=Artemisia annua TaxID=35608 RepID=A0A2U1M2C0_ARTAN|nr:hypothetical protein CTI12_AA428460 [Artemisia annua]